MSSSKVVVISYDKYKKLINVYNRCNEQVVSETNNIQQSYNKDTETNGKEIHINDNLKVTDDQMNHPQNVTKDEINSQPIIDMLTDEDILNYMPKSYIQKCKIVLHHMKKANIKWDSFGRLVLGDECICNTHIVDLIRDVIGNYKRNNFRKASRLFFKLLISSHCPYSILNKNFLTHNEVD